MEIIFLGTGTSHGVPSIDCMLSEYKNCPKGVCSSSVNDIKHRRTRSSILIESDEGSLLVDVSADFRYQMLRESVKKIDAVLLTHSHSDHIGGIPDIRSYTTGRAMTVYGSAETLDSVKKSFEYIFSPDTFEGGGIPKIDLKVIDRPFTLLGQKIIPVCVEHGNLKGVYGYRIGNLGYISDVKSISNTEIKKLEGVDTLILNCLRISPVHSTHLVLDESMELARKVAPRQCYFIHMCHDIHYIKDSEKLDSWMQFSYDGLRIKV